MATYLMGFLVTYNRPVDLQIYNRIGDPIPFPLVLDDGEADDTFEVNDPVVAGRLNPFLGTIMVPNHVGGEVRIPVIQSGLANQVFMCVEAGVVPNDLDFPQSLDLDDLNKSDFVVNPPLRAAPNPTAKAIEMIR